MPGINMHLNIQDLEPPLSKVAQIGFLLYHNHRTLKRLEPEVCRWLNRRKLLISTNKYTIELDHTQGTLKTAIEPGTEPALKYLDAPREAQCYCNELILIYNNQEKLMQYRNQLPELLEQVQKLSPNLYIQQGRHTLHIQKKDNTVLIHIDPSLQY